MNKHDAVLGLTLLAVIAFAQTKSGPPRAPKTLQFLTAAEIDPSRVSAPPAG
jgi:hypothetical protein